MFESKSDFAIVGGGFYGALIALLLCKNHKNNVHIIEQSGSLCGLYRSAWSTNMQHFDYGSRCIIGTGIDTLDDTLFDILDERQFWKKTESLKEFSYQKGRLCEYSACLDARLLDPESHRAGLEQLLDIDENEFTNHSYNNLEQLCNAKYGNIFTDLLFKPAFKKVSGLAMANAHIDALQTYGLDRIIVANTEDTKRLKSIKKFNDDRIAFATHADHKSKLLKAYPIRNGLDVFASQILEHLTNQKNVVVHLNSTINKAEIKEKSVRRITLSKGQQFDCDAVICTVPPVKIADVFNVSLQGLSPPKARHLLLTHIVCQGETKSNAYFHYNYDQNYTSYRSTFYNNFSERPKSESFVTVESHHTELESNEHTHTDIIFQELKSSGLINKEALITDSKVQRIRNAAPQPTIDMKLQQAELSARFKEKTSNLYIISARGGLRLADLLEGLDENHDI